MANIAILDCHDSGMDTGVECVQILYTHINVYLMYL